MVRSPGAYFDVDKDSSGRTIYKASIIPNRGAWLEFETDASDIVWVHVDRTRKLPVTVLLKAIGYGSAQEILELFGGENELIRNTLERDNTNNEEEALIEIYKRLRPGEPPAIESARSLLNRSFRPQEV